MTFRTYLAAAAAATVLVACGQAPEQKTTPVSAREPQKLGDYRMTITPVAGSNGKLLSIQTVPVGKDGNPSTNPAGTVQVFGTFSASTVAFNTGGNPCTTAGINAPVTLTNFAIDPLANAYIQMITTPDTGDEPCNPLTAGTYPGNIVGGWTWGFSPATIGGSSVNTGAVAGGTALANLWFKYTSPATKVINFTLWADPSEPTKTSTAAWHEVAQPLTFTSTAAAARIEVCPSAAPCGTFVAATGSSGTFSATPTLVNGSTYFWRANNLFGGTPGNYYTSWTSFRAVNPPGGLAPIGAARTFLANSALPITISWTTANAIVPETYLEICDNVADTNCLTPIFAGNVAPTFFGTTGYSFDLGANIPDTATGGHWFLPGTYKWRVRNTLAAQAPTSTDLTKSGLIFVTPVAVLPSALAPNQNATPTATPVALSWSTDVNVGNCEVLLCTNPTCTTYVMYGSPPQVALYTNLTPAVAGATTNDYTLTLNLDPAGNAFSLPAGTTFWWQVYASDFALTPAPIATDSVIGTFRTP